MASWASIYLLMEWLIRIAMVVVVPFRRSPEAAKGWLLLVFFLPVPALALYLAIGRPRFPKWRRDRFERLPVVLSDAMHEIAHSAHCQPPIVPKAVLPGARLVEKLGHFPSLSGNRIDLLTDYDESIARLVADIDGARRHVHLTYFIFATDDVGEQVLAALARAADRGVRCRILVDAVGSRRWADELRRRLESAAIEFALALPVRFPGRRWSRADLRNHRKLAVIDGSIGYLGSQNLVDTLQSLGNQNIDIQIRVEGPAVLEMQTVFLADWFLETERRPEEPGLLPHRPGPGGVLAQVLPSGPDYPTAGAGHLFVSMIHGASVRVSLTTPYFIPDEPLLQALTTAAMRGVTVQLVLSDLPGNQVVNLAQRSYYAEILEAGGEIHLERTRLLHAKALTIDDEMVVIGSSNFDVRSFRLNGEISLVTYDRAFAKVVRSQQDRYRASAGVLEYSVWRARPLSQQVLENLARLMSPLL